MGTIVQTLTLAQSSTMSGARFPSVAPTLTERTMGRIALLWLLLTPLWIAFSFYASVSKIAFIPPALVVIAVALHWLHNKFVLLVAGEHEPTAEVQLSESAHFRPIAAAPVAAAALIRLRPALIATGVGACIGAIATSIFLFDRPLYEQAVANKRTAALAAQPNSTIDLQPKAVKSQSFSGEQSTQSNSGVALSDNPDDKRAEVQSQVPESSIDQPRCNVSLCESYYQSFRPSDCTYQPYSGPRQYCAR